MKENYFIIHGSFGSPFSNWFGWLHGFLEDDRKEVYVPDFPSGVGFLMAAFNDAEAYGHKLYFLSLSNEAEKALAATGFKNEFHLINSITEAT